MKYLTLAILMCLIPKLFASDESKWQKAHEDLSEARLAIDKSIYKDAEYKALAASAKELNQRAFAEAAKVIANFDAHQYDKERWTAIYQNRTKFEQSDEGKKILELKAESNKKMHEFLSSKDRNYAKAYEALKRLKNTGKIKST
jgi:hypothetical protein